jgi:hypothetical protein
LVMLFRSPPITRRLKKRWALASNPIELDSVSPVPRLRHASSFSSVLDHYSSPSYSIRSGFGWKALVSLPQDSSQFIEGTIVLELIFNILFKPCPLSMHDSPEDDDEGLEASR